MYQNITIFLDQLNPYYSAILLILAKIGSGLLFLPGTPLTILAGVILGSFWGTIVSIIGNTLAAVLSFLMVRYLLRSYVEKKFISKNKNILEYDNKLFKNGLRTVILLRLVPLFPFNVLNFVLPLTRVSLKDYFIGTLVGIIPGTFVFVYFGESLRMFSWVNILISICLIFLLAFFTKKIKI